MEFVLCSIGFGLMVLGAYMAGRFSCELFINIREKIKKDKEKNAKQYDLLRRKSIELAKFVRIIIEKSSKDAHSMKN